MFRDAVPRNGNDGSSLSDQWRGGTATPATKR